MLTDVFISRYEKEIWGSLEPAFQRALLQGFRIVKENLYPYYVSGKAHEQNKKKWELFDQKLSTELGRMNLSNRFIGQYMYTAEQVCENFYLTEIGATKPDLYIKERLSFIEIAFQERYKELKGREKSLLEPIQVTNAPPPISSRSSMTARGIRLPGDPRDGERALMENLWENYNTLANELNTKFRQAELDLSIHNGLIQFSPDNLTGLTIEQPFWQILQDSIWENVDLDMKTAIDLRDNGGRDPGWYAARALESAIKVISTNKGWNTGSEKGAVNYLDNLLSAKKGKFILQWEHDILAKFFGTVRNPLGHGPGSAPMVVLSQPQTDWCIEFCMSWIKNLCLRYY